MRQPRVPLVKLVHLVGCLMQLGVVVACKLAANLCDVWFDHCQQMLQAIGTKRQGGSRNSPCLQQSVPDGPSLADLGRDGRGGW